MKVLPVGESKPDDENGIKDYDDDDSQASSSLNSKLDEEEEELRRSRKLLDKKSAFLRQKAELKDKILSEVMAAVMPDIGAYDIDGMVRGRVEKKKGMVSRSLQILGLLDLELHEAVMTGSLFHVQRSIRRIMTGKHPNPLMINQYDEKGNTPLALAVKTRNVNLVNELLSKNALVDIGDEGNGRTPLIYSVLQGTHEITKLLLNFGATVDLSDFQCITPLMIAASQDDLLHCRMLCAKLAEVDSVDENGWTPLHYGAFGNALECCHFILTEGADRHKKDMNKRKPIDIAKFKNHGEIVALLSTFKL